MRAFLVSALLLASAAPGYPQAVDPFVTGEPPQAAPGGEAPRLPLPGAQAPVEPPAPPLPSGPESRPGPERPRAEMPRAPAGLPLSLPAAPDARKTHLDELFAQLKREPSAAKAETIAARIGAEWGDSGSATVDLLMRWGTEAMSKQQSAAAFDLLDQAILLKPDCAEAWNRRATLNYTQSNYAKSLADIEKTLTLEPRHYGALSGLAMILEETDRKPQALATYLRILDIYPTLKAAQDAVGRLSEELAGQPT